MPSPLILKIQAQLDRRGFDDVKRQVERLKATIDNLGDTFQDTEKKSGDFGRSLLAISAAVTTALLVVGIRQERVTAQLANSLVGLGVDADSTADAIGILTTEMAKNSVFSRRELLPSFAELFRSTSSITLASTDLALAQEIALRANVRLEVSAKALALANVGLGDSLARLTGLSSIELEAARERGELQEELLKDFPIGEATGRELQTISGALEKFKNQATASFDEVGRDLVDKIKPATDLIISGINIATTLVQQFARQELLNIVGRLASFQSPFRPLAEDLGDAIVAAEQTEAQIIELNEQFKIIDVVLRGNSKVRQEIFKTSQAELSATTLTTKELQKQLKVTREILETKLESGEFDDEEVKSLVTRERAIEAELGVLQRRRAELAETQRTQKAIDQTTLRDQARIFLSLSLSSEDFARQELDNELRKLENVKAANQDNAETLRVIQLAITNNRIRASKLELSVATETIEKRISLQRQLFSLLQTAPRPFDETEGDPFGNRRREAAFDLVRAKRAELTLIEQEEVAALAVLRIRVRNKEITESEAVTRTKIIEAEARAQKIQIEEEFAARIEPIVGLSPGRAAFSAERALRRADLLRADQEKARDEQTRDLDEQLLKTDRLFSVERDIQRLREGGARLTEEGSAQIERLLDRAAQLREDLGDTIIPTSEEAVDTFIEAIERKLDIPPININLNLDRVTLLEDIRLELDQELERRGFNVERTATAPSGPDGE